MENAENNDVSSNLQDSKFVEFWVPVQLSNVQLEQYCATLLSNAMALRSSSKSDTLGTLNDIFVTNRKCCNHPYTVDPKVQQSLMKDKDQSMVVDVGTEASGKLQFLDHILPEIQKQQLKVLILFQHTGGALSGSLSLGHILVDFIHRRFGENSYEHMDGVPNIPSKKQAAVNMFNKDMTKFIFLLESRACQQSIKLSSVDAIIIFDSDLNPFNDLKSLQKLSIDSQSEQIMIFRLYSTSTLEEKILKLAENDMALDIRSQSLRINYDALLTWGASDLFDKLTKFHSQTVISISSEESFLKDVVEEFLYILSNKCKSNDTTSKSIITRVQNCGIYGKNTLLHVEVKTHLPDGVQPYIFWRKLLEGRLPVWKFVSESTTRQRKRPNYFFDSPPQRQSDVDGGGVKLRKMTVNISTIEPAQLRTVSEGETEGVNEGVSAATNESESLSGDQFWSTTVNNETSLSDFLKPTVSELCNILKFSEDVKIGVEKFLEFVLDNYKVSKEHTSILQAFMISLCWIGSSIAKNKIDRSESFALAKKHFNFSCDKEQAESVYKKLKQVKGTFLECTQVRPAVKNCVLAPEGVKLGIDSSQHITNVDASNENVSRKGVEEVDKINRERDEKRVSLENGYKVENSWVVHSDNAEVVPTLPENLIEPQSPDEPACEGASDIESTGSHTSEKETVGATVSSEQIGEVPAQQLDDDMEIDVADKVDSSHETSKGGTSSPDVSHDVEDPVEKLKMLEGEFANKLEEHEKLWENCLEELKVTMLAAVRQVAANEDHDDSCSSDSGNPVCTTVSQDKTSSDQSISSTASVHEIQNEPLQREPLPESGVQDQEINVGNLQPSGVGQLDRIILDDEPDSPSSTDPMVAENSYTVSPSGPLLEPAFEEPTHTVPESGEHVEEGLAAAAETPHEEQQPRLATSVAPTSPVNALKMFDNLTNRVSPEMQNQTDPLQAEVEWLHTEKDNVTKLHQETKQRLDSECEKEIAEIVAQIRLKYEAKYIEADAAYNSEKMELETNINTVLMSRMLAEAFRCKCQNLTPGDPSIFTGKE